MMKINAMESDVGAECQHGIGCRKTFVAAWKLKQIDIISLKCATINSVVSDDNFQQCNLIAMALQFLVAGSCVKREEKNEHYLRDM